MYARMQALAHRATPEQMLAAAVSLGYVYFDEDLCVGTSCRLKFYSPEERARRFTAEDMVRARADGASLFLRMLYHDTLNKVYHGCATITKQRGPESAEIAEIEEEVCGRICAAFEAVGVVMTVPTESERAFATCGGSFTTL